MKRLNLLLIVFAAGLMSCGNSQNRKPSGADTATRGTAASAALSEDAREFADKAATGGLLEVELGKLAQNNALNKRVKAFGRMMVTDHSKANSELRNIAAQKNVALPSELTEDQRSDLEKLRSRKGVSFDKAYVKMMLSAHRKDVSEFEKYSKKGSDPELAAFASKTLPVLKNHLDSAKSINKEVKASLSPGDITEGTLVRPIP